MAGSCVQALYDFPQDAEEDLGLVAGDVIKVKEVLNDEWLLGTSKTGSGQFPASYVQEIFETMPESVGIAISDFNSEEEGDLPFKKDEVIAILEEIDENWLSGCTKTSSGIFPRSFVEVVEFSQDKDMVQSTVEPINDDHEDSYGMSNEAFTAQSPEEISFPKGVRIELVKEVDSFWTVGVYNGKEGKFPTMFINVVRELPEHLKYMEEAKAEVTSNSDSDETLPKAKALFMYVGASQQDLNFDKGDTILLKERINADWLKGQIGNSIGIFPASYVQVLIDLPPQKPSQNLRTENLKVQNDNRNGHLPGSEIQVPKKRVPPTVVKARTNKEEKKVASPARPRPVPLKPRLAPKPPTAAPRPIINTNSSFPIQTDCITVIKPDKSATRKEKKSTKSKPAPVPRPLSKPVPRGGTAQKSNANPAKAVPTVQGNMPNGKPYSNNKGVPSGLNTTDRKTVIAVKRSDPDTANKSKQLPHFPGGNQSPQHAHTTKRPAPPLPSSTKNNSRPVSQPVININTNDLLSADASPVSKLPKPLAPQPPSTLPIKPRSPLVPKSAGASPSTEVADKTLKFQLEVASEENKFDTNEIEPPRRKAFTPPPERKPRPKSAYYLQTGQSRTMKKSASLTRRNTTRASTRSSSKFFIEMAAAANGEKSPDEETDLTTIEMNITEVQSEISAEANLLSGVETLLEVVKDNEKINELKIKQNQHLAIIRELNEDLSDLEDEKSYILAKYGKAEDIMNRILRVEQQIQMFKTKSEQLEQTVDISTFEDLAEVREDTEFCRCMVETLQEELVTLRVRLSENQKQFLTPEETKAKQLEQRAKVVEELIRTERDYVRDISLCSTKVIAALKASTISAIDCETLFGNMKEVADVSTKLLQSLEVAVRLPPDEMGTTLGHCFIDLSTELKGCYANYCKLYDDAQVLSEKYEQDPVVREEIMAAMALIRGENLTWDLPSYLIKPVQRILKYPLLLQEFLKNTPEHDPSRADTALAINSMTDVATSINEFKRRKDLVQKYQRTEGFGDKISRLNWHSVIKKSSRMNQRLTQFTGINARTVDSAYDEEEKKVRGLEKLIKTLIKNVSVYIEGSQEQAALHKLNIGNIYEFCEDLSPPDQVKQYIFVSQNLVDVFNKHVNYIQSNVFDPLNNLLQVFQSPFRLMEKREDKLLDYDSLQKKSYRTKDKDKLKQVQDDLAKAKNNYQALNSQLLEELPKLSAKCSKYVILCLANFIQAHRRHSMDVKNHLGALPQTAIPTDSAAILSMHSEAIHLASEQLAKLTFTPERSSTLLDNRKSLHIDALQNASGTLGRTNFYIDYSVLDSDTTGDPTSPIRPNPEDMKELLDFENSPIRPAKKENEAPPPFSLDTSEIGMKPQVEEATDIYRVKFSFDAEDKAEITVGEGDLVRVINKSDKSGNSEWWLVQNSIRKGYIPSSYLEFAPSEVSLQLNTPEGQVDDSTGTDVAPRGVSENNSAPTSGVEAHSGPNETSADFNSDSAHIPEDSTPNVDNTLSVVASDEEVQIAEFYVAEYDFEKSNVGEFNLTEGQLVRVINKHDYHGNTEWWLVEADGIKGYVPGNYLSFVHSVQLG